MLIKDTTILSESFDNIVENSLFEEARRINNLVIENAVHEIGTILNQKTKDVLMIGTSFKSEPMTTDIRDSHSIETAELQSKMNMRLRL